MDGGDIHSASGDDPPSPSLPTGLIESNEHPESPETPETLSENPECELDGSHLS